MAETRPLHAIADEIIREWPKVSPYAEPYLDAMRTLGSVHNNYGADSGKSIVLYFLSNASGWRGEAAKRIKAELRGMVK
jgi:hypothetical protein